MRLSVAIFLSLISISAAIDLPPQLADRIDLIASEKAIPQTIERFIKEAEGEAGKPVIRRPATLAQLIADPQASTKYDEKPAHQQKLTDEEWERFALSLGDANINGTLALRLPRMAAAYRLSKNPKLLDATISQLREMSSWRPLERPGSTATKGNITPAPWLGSGWGVRGIVDTLEILSSDDVPPDLDKSLRALLESEISDVRTAWIERRLWYTKPESAYSNQWMLPMEALIRSSLYLGKKSGDEDYEFGITNLLRSLKMQGKSGEFVEGFSYSALTMSSIYSVAEATARSGDRRLIEHPFLKKFPIWYVHHLQPGNEMINAFDSKAGVFDPHLLARMVVVSGSPEAAWATKKEFRGRYGHSLNGIFAQALSKDAKVSEPPLFAKYDVAARINWRSSWDDDAAGFWMRGGHSTDAHDHMDRGHISYSIGKRKLLIEAGLLSYGVPQHPTHYKSVAGHNVLQVGKEEPKQLSAGVLKRAGQLLNTDHRAAPISVDRMDADGGSASVDMSGCYASTKRWVRHVKWDRKGVEVTDDVELADPDVITFRWHLGESADARHNISGTDVTVGKIQVSMESSTPLDLSVAAMPGYDATEKKETDHACVVVRSAGAVGTFRLVSKIRFAE